ncbi:UNVERIFIED_CONTAM: hypothetical protein Sangu_2032800 [Sesamum angustifolium]|uniref:Uncharacterized protein n=1 Tax=Sesamum angustifolium TaxID=2727405 RepID=A0AAW2LIA5_9LAMI
MEQRRWSNADGAAMVEQRRWSRFERMEFRERLQRCLGIGMEIGESRAELQNPWVLV